MWRWLAIPIGILALGSAGALIAAVPGAAAHPLGVLGVTLIVAVVPFALVVLPANDARQTSKVIRSALKSESLEQFELCRAATEGLDVMSATERQGYLRDVPLEILVVPDQDLIVQHDRSPNILLESVPIVTLGITDHPSVVTGPRPVPLSESELHEIRNRRKAILRSSLKFAAFYIALTVMLASILVLLALSPSTLLNDISFSVLVSLGWIYLTWVLIFRVCPQLLLAHRFGRDLTDATCEVLDGKAALDELYAGDLPDALRPHTPPLVVRRLQYSKLWWLLDDTPAMWRRCPS